MNQDKPQTLPFGFALGFLATLTQILLMREFWTIPGLGELSLGMVLCSWLIYVAAGAWLGRRVPFTGRNVNIILGTAALLLPAALLWVRFYEPVFSVPQGEPLQTSIFLALCIIAPLPGAVLSGLLFTSFAQRITTAGGDSVQRMYMAEGAGAAVAGLGHAFVFTHLTGALTIVLAGLCLLGIACALTPGRTLGITRWLLTMLIFTAAVSAAAFDFDGWSQRAAFDTHPVRGQCLGCTDTEYQRLCLGRQAEQYQLYRDGRLAYVFPDPFDRPRPIHLAMALHPNPQRVLIIGGGVANRLEAARMHHPREIHYLDVDAREIPFLARWRDTRIRRLLNAKGIFLHSGYHRTFLSGHPRQFDVIVQFVAAPFTAAENASHSKSFFEAVDGALSEDGVFVVVSAGSANVTSPPAAQLLASRYATLKSVFSEVTPVIDVETLFLATRRAQLSLSPKRLNHRLDAVDPALRYVVQPDEIFAKMRLSRSLSTVTEHAGEVNVDDHPQTFLHALTLQRWIRDSSLATLSDENWQQMRRETPTKTVSLALGAFILLGMVVLLWHPGSPVPAELLSIGTTGLCGLGMEVILIYWFSVIHGGLYHHIAWLVAGFMTGLSLGAYIGNRFKMSGHARLAAETGVVLTGILVTGLTVQQHAGPVAFAAAMCLAGGVTGFAFPVFLQSTGTCRKTAVSRLVAADHLGAAAGALLVSALWLPQLGLYWTCVLMIMFKVPLLVKYFKKKR